MGQNEYGGESELDDIFVSELKAKELTITGSSVLLFLLQCENKNVDLITMGSVIFGIQIKISSDLLCPTIPIFPNSTLQKLSEVFNFIICAIFVLEKVKLFSKVAGAAVFKSRYGLIAFIDVVFYRNLQIS